MAKKPQKDNIESLDPGYFSLSRYDIFKMREGLEEMVKAYDGNRESRKAPDMPDENLDRAFPRFGYHTLTDENIFGMIESVGKMLETSDTDPKRKKMSYSISPLAQSLVKAVSEHSGATQGSIVELAPLFFGIFAQKSLDRREKALGTLEILKKQISSSAVAMAEMAPHLKIYITHISEVLEEMVAMEKEAVAQKNYSGVNVKPYKQLMAIGREPCPPPYYKEIEDLLDDDAYLQALFQNIVNG